MVVVVVMMVMMMISVRWGLRSLGTKVAAFQDSP